MQKFLVAWPVSAKHLSQASEDALRGHLADEYPIAIDSSNGLLIKLDEVRNLEVPLPADMEPVYKLADEQGVDWLYFDFGEEFPTHADLPVLR
jgi:hypothetical protein